MTTEASDSPAGPVAGATATRADRIAVWPALVGVVAAAGVILGGDLAAVVLVCAAIYLLAAATGRPWSAWIGFAASVPVIGLGRLLHVPWLPLAVIATSAVVLVIVGIARRAWRRRENVRQLAGMLGFGAAAVVAAALGEPVAVAVVAIVALLAHAAWDIWHHATGEVVARPYAEFCAALDIALALAVTAVTWLGVSLPGASL